MTKKITQKNPILPESSYFIDTHCHLDMASYADDRDHVFSRATDNNVKKIISIGIDLESSKSAIQIARKNTQVTATIGIHPHDVDNINDTTYDSLAELFSQHSHYIAGYGEIGLDYFKKYSDLVNQRKHFAKQLDLAHEFGLPVIIHNREATDDTLKIINKAKPFDHGGIMHCFSGDYAFARKIIDMGLLISIPGIVTFKNAITLHDVVKKVPISSLVLETDAPFLAPHPFRGKRNEPGYIPYIAQKIAEIKQISLEQVADKTTENAENIFKNI